MWRFQSYLQSYQTLQAFMLQKVRENPENSLGKGISFKVCEKVAEKWEPEKFLVLKDGLVGTFPLESITKVKIKTDETSKGFFLIKITANERDFFFRLTEQVEATCFVEILNAKLASKANLKPYREDYINVCEGNIYLKSFFGKWQQNYVFISKAGLTVSSSKDSKSELYIQKIKELWTRYELIQQQTYLVFKIKYSVLKYEFAVPVLNAIKWAKAFSSLLQHDQRSAV